MNVPTLSAGSGEPQPFTGSPPIEVSLELLGKYNVPGPRYTSYPTALNFRAHEAAELIGADPGAAGKPGPVSVYFHLPFCESRCWFCGCTTVITRQRDSADRYLDYLEKEVVLTLPHLGGVREAVQVHFGGGTPTFLTPDQLRRLGGLIRRSFRLSPETEFSVEIDPRRLTREHITALREIGANRASLGVQDSNPTVQQAVNRIQPQALNEQAISWLRQEGFRSINIDLIYGLPRQTPESFEQTLREVLTLDPDRLAVFSYAHVPWVKPAQKILEQREELPSGPVKLAMFHGATRILESRGYVLIGLDHFAKADDELARAQKEGTLQRNFQGYSTNAGSEIAAFGMSAIAQTAEAYRQNHKDLLEYYGALDRGELPVSRGYRLTREDRLRRTTIMRLMCDLRLDYAEMSQRLGIDFARHFAAELDSLQEMEADGLVERLPHRLEVTDLGRYFIRNIAMRFDAYLTAEAQGYSRTV